MGGKRKQKMWSGRKEKEVEELRGRSRKRTGCSLVDTAAARVRTCAHVCVRVAVCVRWQTVIFV